MANILNLYDLDFPLLLTRERLHTTCLTTLKAASRANKFGFRSFGQFLLHIPAIQNEILWLTKQLYCSGLDKAANNACFICIKHIRLQAFECLRGADFTPYMDLTTWYLPTSILDQVTEKLKKLLPESPPLYIVLPYLMAIYKHHKAKYRWLTNAYHTVYSNIASLLTITLNLILDTFKAWARNTE